MKNLILMTAMIGLSSLAQAKVKMVQGSDALTVIRTQWNGTMDGMNPDKGGEPCAVYLQKTTSGFIMTFSEKGQPAQRLFFAAQKPYHLGESDAGETSILVVAGKSQMLRIENASDAWVKVTTRINGVSMTCEADM